MTTFNPFNIPSESRSYSQSGISQFDALMFQSKIDGNKVVTPHSFAIDVIVTNQTQIANLMEDTVDLAQKITGMRFVVSENNIKK